MTIFTGKISKDFHFHFMKQKTCMTIIATVSRRLMLFATIPKRWYRKKLQIDYNIDSKHTRYYYRKKHTLPCFYLTKRAFGKNRLSVTKKGFK